MEPENISKITNILNESFNKVEAEHRTVKMSPFAKRMIEDIILESLTTRASEWQTRANVSLAYNSDATIPKIRSSVDKILHDAWLKQKGGYITTRDVLEAINANWCNIFPLC